MGKTSLLSRYGFSSFDPAYRGTLGANLRCRNVQEAVAGRRLVEAETAFFDLMGETAVRNRFKDIFFGDTHGFIAVAEVTRPATVDSLADWIRTVQGVAGDVPFRILVNKADRSANRAISPEATAALLDTFPRVPYRLTSAKTGAGADRAFDALTDAMVSAALERAKGRRPSRLVGDRILAFAERRGTLGIGMKEILSASKDIDGGTVRRQVDDLQTLGLVTVEQTGPASFRLRIPAKGERELDRLLAPERIRDGVA